MTSYTRSGDVTTPIHAAAENGDVDALLRALESGASPHAIDQNKSTPLQYVCSRPDNDDGRLACLQRAARGIKKYERDHLNALAATFLPKLPSLPPEMVRRVVEYAFHVGDY